MKNRISLLLLLLLALFVAIALSVWWTWNARTTNGHNFSALLKKKLELEKELYNFVLEHEKNPNLVFPEVVLGLDDDPFNRVISQRHEWSSRWLQSELELRKSQKKRITAYEGHFQRMAKLHELDKKRKEVIDLGPKAALRTRYYLLAAELMLEKAKSE